MRTVDCETERAGEYPQRIRVRERHELRGDEGPANGGQDTAPSPHDYFDAALASCKAATALWFAKRKGIPLERVEAHVDRDDGEERSGRYKLRVRMAYHGPLTDEDRARLDAAVARCPIHKLMTTSEIEIEMAPPGG
jgi:putative redox protein